MHFRARFNIPVSDNYNQESEFQKSDFRQIASFDSRIGRYSFRRNANTSLRGYTDDEDADLDLRDVTQITCYSHGEIVAEIVVSEKIIIRLDRDINMEENKASFEFYLLQDHLRFGKLLFLTVEDLE